NLKRSVLRFGAACVRSLRSRHLPGCAVRDKAMKIPFNMSTPNIKLAYGEEVLHSFGTLRRKGIFGNRYGEVHITNQRVAFVKAVMASGLAGLAVSKFGAKASIAFDLSAIKSIQKLPVKKQFAIEISDGKKTERFMVDESEADAAVAVLGERR